MSLVLVVDDHRDTCRLLARLLRAEGLDPVTLHSGRAAINFARTDPRSPALVLLDIMMPGMNGFETLQQLRATPTAASVPVVMLSAMADDENRQRAAELGAADYWVKGTFDPAQLGKMIRRHLGHLRACHQGEEYRT